MLVRTETAARPRSLESNRACRVRARRSRSSSATFSPLSEVRRFAESFQARFDRLDVLVHNAGVLPQRRTYTAEGVELAFATKVLGPFLLTSLLLPGLLAADRPE